jgi:dTDP-4-dehydrorhamnose reductase
MRIAILGARGQLGAAMAAECAKAHDAVALGHADLDVTDDRAVAAAMARVEPDAIVNCAGYNDVDGAEDHPVDALNANAFAVRALARAADARAASLVHFSTDFVFDGMAARPYTEDDRPNPRGVYAASKLLGEWFALDAAKGYVLRVESLFGCAPGGAHKGSVATILRTLRSGQTARVFEDRTVSPSYVHDVARATRELLERSPAPGIYHCVSAGSCTWLEFARELAKAAGLEPRLEPVKMADVPLRAPRPQYCVLSIEKLLSAGIAMPTWQDAVARYVAATSRR